MVSNADVRVIKEDLERTGFIRVEKIVLGEADIQYDAQVISMEIIAAILRKDGYELISDENIQLVEKVKTAVIQLIFYGNNTNSIMRNSDFLSERLGHPYTHISKIFSERTGTTLEKYIILIKIERIKELITYNEMTLSEIAWQMGYSSVQYLSNQFKQITGYSVSEYKNLLHPERKPLSEIL